MKHFKLKFRLLCLPFLVISLCILIGYTLLNWIFNIRMHVIPLKEETINVVLPFLLPWLPVITVLWPRIRLLDLNSSQRDPKILYIIMAGIAIVMPTFMAQTYLGTATGKLTTLDNINQIALQPATRYYTLKNYYVSKTRSGTMGFTSFSGKRSQVYEMKEYVALPVFATPSDTFMEECVAFLGTRYEKEIGNPRSDEGRNQHFQSFAEDCLRDIASKDVNPFVYLQRIDHSKEHDRYMEAIDQYNGLKKRSPVVLLPVNEPFEEHNNNMLAWTLVVWIMGLALWLFMITIVNFDLNEVRHSDLYARIYMRMYRR